MSLSNLTTDEDVLNIFSSVFKSYGADITRYKSSFIKRRLGRRMGILGLKNYLDYEQVLKKNSVEFEELFMSLSINVTNFFRDSIVYESFKSFIMPKILANVGPGGRIRIWSAGCASGEEPYSIAIMLLSALEKSDNFSIEIVANDISRKAIEYAQRGKYSVKSVEKLPPNVVTKYFQKIGNTNTEYEVNSSVKNQISFKICDILSNDVKQIDAIFCRNVLIYYGRESQELILSKFHKCLKEHSYLVLGMDETMLGRKCEKLFNPVMARERIYQKILPNN
ncbi:MAG: protein-glutamate O-methyltransferase CheR [Thaumarchaeota archaeon]|nr:protein-glutamate O-methyltransferase CheR [Nitrososphaerota archaeon]